MANINANVAPINPFKKVSAELFEHGKEHLFNTKTTNRSFERLVAGVHFDNSLELYLKYFTTKYNIPGCDRQQVPGLITALQRVLPELSDFTGDLVTFHLMRNGAYHAGNPLDETNLIFGYKTIESFYDAVRPRERAPLVLHDGGNLKHSNKRLSKSEKELNKAIQLFSQIPPNDYKQMEVLIRTLRAVELWIDETLAKNSSINKDDYRMYSMGKKLDILRQEGLVKDLILLGELADLNKLRNKVAHASGKNAAITTRDVNHYLQIATHFIKVKSPSAYSTESLPTLIKLKTLAHVNVKSKSELIIANILTSLGLSYEYEKPLPSKDGSSQKIPDFTIRYNEKEFYWEHKNTLASRYTNYWQDKLNWYRNNGYYERLIVSTESVEGFDSSEIEELAKQRIIYGK